ncbi:hypothetical protein [uncultured Algibacter sp.]|uniref:hypothetical protein n=1 Tax=uncultured Algibacter sp. TaxID=298659 RepID=UPI0030EE66A5
MTPKKHVIPLQLILKKTLGGTKNESAQAVVKTSDCGYAILGHAQSMDGDITNKSHESFDY